jgi:hypothetical protein
MFSQFYLVIALSLYFTVFSSYTLWAPPGFAMSVLVVTNVGFKIVSSKWDFLGWSVVHSSVAKCKPVTGGTAGPCNG